VSYCGRTEWHGPHWNGEHHDERCNGLGLGAICDHGVQMLNQCDDCEAAERLHRIDEETS
jgi:hypothetical protein